MTKPEVLTAIRSQLSEKRNDLQAMLQDLQAGLADDTKSSAGDKYETSREMSNQEFEKIALQLAEINRQLALLHQLEQSNGTEKVVSGSLVTTNNGLFLIGVPAGAVSVNGSTVYCISANAPAAQALLNRKSGESLTFNGSSLTIHSVS